MAKSFLKTFIKGTILVAVFSLFLQIDMERIVDYLIFLAAWYIMLLSYIYWKSKNTFELREDSIVLRNPLKSTRIPFSGIVDCFYVQGYLQKRFGLYSVYIISSRGNYAIRDTDRGPYLTSALEPYVKRNNGENNS